jgi:hypothetical protein
MTRPLRAIAVDLTLRIAPRASAQLFHRSSRVLPDMVPFRLAVNSAS